MKCQCPMLVHMVLRNFSKFILFDFYSRGYRDDRENSRLCPHCNRNIEIFIYSVHVAKCNRIQKAKTKFEKMKAELKRKRMDRDQLKKALQELGFGPEDVEEVM